MPFVSLEDATVYWKVEGDSDRPRLVLLNSIGTDMDLWDAALPGLRRHFQLLRIDTRGHGASRAYHGDFRMAQLARDVAAAMTAAGWDSACLAGVSLGGMIAMELALAQPERVRSLVLICTSATMDRTVWAARVDTVRSKGMAAIADQTMERFLSPSFISAQQETAMTIRRGLLSMAPEGYAGCAAAIRDMTLAERIDAIDCPTLVVTGADDVSTPFEGHGEHLVARIAGARHSALPCAHLAPVEAPDLLVAALNDFES